MKKKKKSTRGPLPVMPKNPKPFEKSVYHFACKCGHTWDGRNPADSCADCGKYQLAQGLFSPSSSGAVLQG